MLMLMKLPVDQMHNVVGQITNAQLLVQVLHLTQFVELTPNAFGIQLRQHAYKMPVKPMLQMLFVMVIQLASGPDQLASKIHA